MRAIKRCLHQFFVVRDANSADPAARAGVIKARRAAPLSGAAWAEGVDADAGRRKLHWATQDEEDACVALCKSRPLDYDAPLEVAKRKRRGGGGGGGGHPDQHEHEGHRRVRLRRVRRVPLEPHGARQDASDGGREGGERGGDSRGRRRRRHAPGLALLLSPLARTARTAARHGGYRIAYY